MTDYKPTDVEVIEGNTPIKTKGKKRKTIISIFLIFVILLGVFSIINVPKLLTKSEIKNINSVKKKILSISSISSTFDNGQEIIDAVTFDINKLSDKEKSHIDIKSANKKIDDYYKEEAQLFDSKVEHTAKPSVSSKEDWTLLSDEYNDLNENTAKKVKCKSKIDNALDTIYKDVAKDISKKIDNLPDFSKYKNISDSNYKKLQQVKSDFSDLPTDKKALVKNSNKLAKASDTYDKTSLKKLSDSVTSLANDLVENYYDMNGYMRIVSKPTVSYDGSRVSIKGKVKNDKGSMISYACITFSVYDNQGNFINTADATITDWQANDTWSYEATSYVGEYSSIKTSNEPTTIRMN